MIHPQLIGTGLTPTDMKEIRSAEEFQQAFNFPSSSTAVSAIKGGVFSNLNGVSPRAIAAHHRFNGPDLARLKGSAVRRPEKLTKVYRNDSEGTTTLTLHVDLFFIRNGKKLQGFLIGISEPYGYISTITCPSRTTSDLLAALRGLVGAFQKHRGIKVTAVQCDGEPSILANDTQLGIEGCALLPLGGDIDGRSERCIRTIKNEMRTLLSECPALNIPFRFVVATVYIAVRLRNILSGAHLALTGQQIDYSKATRSHPWDIMAGVPAGITSNSVFEERTHTFVSLGSNYNNSMSISGFNMHTGRQAEYQYSNVKLIASNHHWTVDQAAIVEQWYTDDKSSAFAHDTVTFLDRNLKPVQDVEPVVDINTAHNSSLPLAAPHIADIFPESPAPPASPHLPQASPVKQRSTDQTHVAPSRGETYQHSPEQEYEHESNHADADGYGDDADSATAPEEDALPGNLNDDLDHEPAPVSIPPEPPPGLINPRGRPRRNVRFQGNNDYAKFYPDRSAINVNTSSPKSSPLTPTVLPNDAHIQQYINDSLLLQMTAKAGVEKFGVVAIKAIRAELEQLHGCPSGKPNGRPVWKGVHMSELSYAEKHSILNGNMILKDKYDSQGKFEKIKARLAAGGNLQDKSLYPDISSPTTPTIAAMIHASIAVEEQRKTATVDITGAYLHALLPADGPKIFIRLNKTLTDILAQIDPSVKQFITSNGSIVLQLLRALYGLLESAKLWNERITKALVSFGFVQNPHEPCTFNGDYKGKQVTASLYVDDLFVSCVDQRGIQLLIDNLRAEFGEITFKHGQILSYLGMTLDFSVPDKVSITQFGYIEDLLKKLQVEGFSVSPAEEKLFTIDQTSPPLGDEPREEYRSVVAILLYVHQHQFGSIKTTCRQLP